MQAYIRNRNRETGCGSIQRRRIGRRGETMDRNKTARNKDRQKEDTRGMNKLERERRIKKRKSRMNKRKSEMKNRKRGGE